MKLLKKIAIFAMSITLCLGASALVTACGGGSSSSSSTASSVESTTSSTQSSEEAPANAYNFIVLNSDGTPAKDVNVQLCMLGDGAACFMPMLTDANGKVAYAFDGFVCFILYNSIMSKHKYIFLCKIIFCIWINLRMYLIFRKRSLVFPYQLFHIFIN